MTGKFNDSLALSASDRHHTVLPFRADQWPHVRESVAAMQAISAGTGRKLAHLANRWLLARPGLASVVGARSPSQIEENARVLEGGVSGEALERLTAVSDALVPHIPDVGNLFNHYP